jgi:hypothetical protein
MSTLSSLLGSTFQGNSGTLNIGTVTTGAAGSLATVTNVGTPSAATLNFGIPQGVAGNAATVAIGTVTTGAAGSAATVTNVGTSLAATLNFSIPKGADGNVTTGKAIAMAIVFG